MRASDSFPLVKILWTGGYDSSYRMIQLSGMPITVQPYYLRDERRSEHHELMAIKQIRADIEKHPETRCTILNPIIESVKDIKPDLSISKAYERVSKLTGIGSQYDFIARFATKVPGLELCLEKCYKGKASDCIAAFAKVEKIAENGIEYYQMIENQTDADVYKLFGNLRFPVPLYHTTKLQMAEEYKRLGYGDTMLKTWFCHTPVNNQPCGICNPCKSVIEEGLSFRIPPQGIRRFDRQQKYGKQLWYIYSEKAKKAVKNIFLT